MLAAPATAAKLPLVGHNCWFDLLFMYASYQGVSLQQRHSVLCMSDSAFPRRTLPPLVLKVVARCRSFPRLSPSGRPACTPFSRCAQRCFSRRRRIGLP